ncbi:lipoprotein signal peptidase [Marinithermofilum abyssi]|uniref:Lipoprotein signal peptidase n=1 Tax=Marinithermofilum abyssi TaxID=1571185 RepID=A0A8J2Y9G9_9BACL|nr:lipoprotein signal peptidase [Marinithermofilum abyssi]
MTALRYYGIAVAVLLLDQVTKWFVLHRMELYESIPVWDDVFHITSHRNRGAAFGILQNQQWLFIGITVVVTAVLLVYIYRLRKEGAMMLWSLSLILGGAVGNLIDRVRFGEVVDFLDFRLIHYPIFNVADSAIVIGVCLMVIVTLRQPAREKEYVSKAGEGR